MSWPIAEDKALLETNGWDVECESPLEIRTKDGSFATGEAAQYVIMGLGLEVQPFVSLTFEEVRICIKALKLLETAQPVVGVFDKLLGKFYTAYNEGLDQS